jgi:DNA helicase II / ATP-dependent DNA helicase PcrA
MPRKSKQSEPKPISLNEEQQAVADTREGFWCVEAGPGSGKTACLVQRFVNLLTEGVHPDDILNLSFTNAAAKNLRERVEAQVGQIETTRPAGSMTFHALALQFAIEERNEFGFELAEFPLAAEPAANRLSSEAARRFELDARSLRPLASLWKRKRLRPSAVIRDCESRGNTKTLKLALAYKDYDRRCREQGVLDFDSLILEMVEILDKKSEVRERWIRDWNQVDEAQDLSKIEWDLVRLISGKSLIAVGDKSQGIYSFRGSDSKLFSEMDKIFPGTKTLFLSCNYRSTPEIIDFFRPVGQNRELAEKFHTSNEHGPSPSVHGFHNPAEEAAWVLSKIQESICPTTLGPQ